MSLPRLCTMQGPGTGVPPAAAADDDRSRRSCDDRRDTAERNIVLLLVRLRGSWRGNASFQGNLKG
jgi:hypothetical protein